MKVYLCIICLLISNTCATQVVKTIIIYNKATQASAMANHSVGSLEAADKLIQFYLSLDVDTIFVFFREGTYRLNKPMRFSHFNYKTVLIFDSYRKEQVVISGGIELPKKWTRSQRHAKSFIWQMQLEDSLYTKWNVHSLICNGKWLNNATSDTFISNGPLSMYKNSVAYYDFFRLKKSYKDTLPSFCAFHYFPTAAISKIHDYNNSKICQINSWETSWHDLLSIDTLQSSIYLANPSCYPVGFYPGNNRFVVYNCLQFFNKPQQWYFNEAQKIIYYFSNAKENPNTMSFVIPTLKHLLIIEGNKKDLVKNIFFRNIHFSHAASNWGIHQTSPDAVVSNVPDVFDIHKNGGFASIQNSIACGESVLLKSAANCFFINCTFSNSENYGIRIGENCSDNVISNCSFKKLGGGGIIIGFDNYSVPTFFSKLNQKNTYVASNLMLNTSNCPTNNKVTDCIVDSCGLVHQGTIGICLMHANKSQVIGNRIKNLPYSGLAVGWWYFENILSNRNNTISYNYISNVVQQLADGGGIYTIGPQFGSIYQYNYIEKIDKSKHAIGAKNNGFFFDVKSEGFTVEHNYVSIIKQGAIRFNECDSAKINFQNNVFRDNENSNTIFKKALSELKKRNKFL